MSMRVTIAIVLAVLSQAHAQDEACETPTAEMAAGNSALLQVQSLNGEGSSIQSGDANSNINNAFNDLEDDDDEAFADHHDKKTSKVALLQHQTEGTGNGTLCSYQLIGDQDGTQPCRKLKGKNYVSGRVAALSETGYQETAKLCCHHEMSAFVRREIATQGFDVCDLSDLHGFVHWYDCTNDMKTYAEMKKEIAGVMTSVCPWLGHLPNCPYKDPVHCGRVAKCNPASYPADSQEGNSAALVQAGYAAVAKRCCHTEMEKYIRKLIAARRFKVCDQGAFQGFLHWFDCTDDKQTFAKLNEGLTIARSGLPPMCPWLGGIGEPCPPKGHNCPVVEVPEPAAHRRREACR